MDRFSSQHVKSVSTSDCLCLHLIPFDSVPLGARTTRSKSKLKDYHRPALFCFSFPLLLLFIISPNTCKSSCAAGDNMSARRPDANEYQRLDESTKKSESRSTCLRTKDFISPKEESKSGLFESILTYLSLKNWGKKTGNK